MNKRSVRWKDGTWLDPNSHAFELYQAKKFKELEQHLKQLNANAQALLIRYESKE